MLTRVVYVKNVPNWERAIRFLMGVMLLVAAIAIFGYSWLSLGIGVIGVMALMTGLIGFCPACALAGRRIDQKAGR